MNLEEDFEPFCKHVWKARDITSTKIFCDNVQQAPGDIRWTIDQAEFDDLIAERKIRLLALMEFLMEPTSVRVVWVRSSSLTLMELAWNV